MKKIRLTKNELKRQKDNLERYNRYLPTLEIKKRLLMREIVVVGAKIAGKRTDFDQIMRDTASWVAVLGEDVGLSELISLESIETATDNIAGVDVPLFVRAVLGRKGYDLFLYPLWVDRAVEFTGKLMTIQAEISVLEEKKRLLGEELRITSQRVNLFERVKIPEAKEAIRRITVRLGDQQTAAVGWARMAKKKLQGATK